MSTKLRIGPGAVSVIDGMVQGVAQDFRAVYIIFYSGRVVRSCACFCLRSAQVFEPRRHEGTKEHQDILGWQSLLVGKVVYNKEKEGHEGLKRLLKNGETVL